MANPVEHRSPDWVQIPPLFLDEIRDNALEIAADLYRGIYQRYGTEQLITTGASCLVGLSIAACLGNVGSMGIIGAIFSAIGGGMVRYADQRSFAIRDVAVIYSGLAGDDFTSFTRHQLDVQMAVGILRFAGYNDDQVVHSINAIAIEHLARQLQKTKEPAEISTLCRRMFEKRETTPEAKRLIIRCMEAATTRLQGRKLARLQNNLQILISSLPIT